MGLATVNFHQTGRGFHPRKELKIIVKLTTKMSHCLIKLSINVTYVGFRPEIFQQFTVLRQ